jgi:predicted nuclease with TOPRIM domain
MHDLIDKASLLELQTKGKEALVQRKKLLTSETVTASETELANLQNRLRELQKENEFTVSKSKSFHAEGARLQERTEHLKKELEKSILQLTNKNTQINLSS